MTASGLATRVLLDATSIPVNEGGVARYLRGLIEGLSTCDDIDLIVVADQKHLEWISRAHPSSTSIAAPTLARRPWARLLWEQCALPAIARRVRATVIHSPHYTFPLATRIPVAVTVHDATFFSHPALHSAVKGRFFRSWLRIDVRCARVLISPSRATLSEVERYTGHRAQSAAIAYHGVDLGRFSSPPSASIERLRQELDIGDDRWIAFLGTIEPRKNVSALVVAFGLLAERRILPADVRLLLAGAPGWDDTVDGAIRRSPVAHRIRRLGAVPEEQLAPLLGGALCVVYPSSGEGFGLPVLEAMATGSPVITTRELALPEVGGDAVSYCEPEPESIAEAIRELLESPTRRQELAEAGPRRAEGFTWAASARLHADAYKRARTTR